VIPEQQVLTIGSFSSSKPTISPRKVLKFNPFHLTKLPTFTDYLHTLGGEAFDLSCVQQDMHDRSQVNRTNLVEH